MVEQGQALAGSALDLIVHAGPLSGVPPDLVRLTDGDAGRVLTVSNHGDVAKALGVRDSFGPLRYDALPEFTRLAAEGRFEVPVAKTYQLDEWRDALDVSQAAGRGVSWSWPSQAHDGAAADLTPTRLATLRQMLGPSETSTGCAMMPPNANNGQLQTGDEASWDRSLPLAPTRHLVAAKHHAPDRG